MGFDQKLGWLSICNAQICSIILIYDHDSLRFTKPASVERTNPKEEDCLSVPLIHGEVSSIIAGRAPLSSSWWSSAGPVHVAYRYQMETLMLTWQWTSLHPETHWHNRAGCVSTASEPNWITATRAARKRPSCSSHFITEEWTFYESQEEGRRAWGWKDAAVASPFTSLPSGTHLWTKS